MENDHSFPAVRNISLQHVLVRSRKVITWGLGIRDKRSCQKSVQVKRQKGSVMLNWILTVLKGEIMQSIVTIFHLNEDSDNR